MNMGIFLGNVTKDASISQTPTGTDYCKFSIAVNDYAGKDKDPNVAFIDCILWGSRAVGLQPHIKKGMRCMVSGKFRQSIWEDKDTKKKRSKLELNVNNFEFCGSKPKDSKETEQVKDTLKNAGATNIYSGQDIPF